MKRAGRANVLLILSLQCVCNGTLRAAEPRPKLPARSDRAAWRRLLQWPDTCEQGFQYPDKSFSGISIFRLRRGNRLVQVTCTLGAYQGYQLYYRVNGRGAARLLKFPVLESPDGKLEKRQTEEVWGTATFDAARRELQVLNRFRGAGDCGTLATYAFQGESVVVVRIRAKPACDGQGAEHPEQWPAANTAQD